MTVISDVRQQLGSQRVSELSIVDSQPVLQRIWQDLQDLREEMNNAKRLAAEEAARPYLVKIKKLEIEYATILRLSS